MDFLQSEEMYWRIKSNFSLRFINQKIVKVVTKPKDNTTQQTYNQFDRSKFDQMSLEEAIEFKRDYQKSFSSTYDP